MSDKDQRILLNTSGVGESRPILNTSGVVNPNATAGAGRGYSPVKTGAQAMPEPKKFNRTSVKVTPFEPVKTARLTGPFYDFVANDRGDIYLRGGTVSAGSGSETIDTDYPPMKLIDADTGPTSSAGTHLYIIATGDGIVTDGVLLQGFNLTAATITTGSSIPANTLPLAAGHTGKKCHIDLGEFTATGFLRSAFLGNISISYCPGSYSISRI